ncbi:hypothetical protein NDU88_007843 [Pleurodeles waltl]|uniref:Uncharacterized protein n=1 Tax=Pleurodeles waltl TaxID=8319 RepID=A0AAV7N7G9_PLEWA|nr:hypothetical protein NDU88_007843 [Pleurodeles waltl]
MTGVPEGLRSPSEVAVSEPRESLIRCSRSQLPQSTRSMAESERSWPLPHVVGSHLKDTDGCLQDRSALGAWTPTAPFATLRPPELSASV